MLGIFNRSPQKNESQNLPPNEPPRSVLESGCYDDCYSKRYNKNNSDNDEYNTDCYSEFTEKYQRIDALLHSAQQHCINTTMLCPMCEKSILKKSHKRLTCSNACRQALYRYRRERDVFTHYCFNMNGSYTQLNKWRSIRVDPSKLTLEQARKIQQIAAITNEQMINAETLEEIKGHLEIRR